MYLYEAAGVLMLISYEVTVRTARGCITLLYAEQSNRNQSSRVIIIIKTLQIGHYKCGWLPSGKKREKIVCVVPASASGRQEYLLFS